MHYTFGEHVCWKGYKGKRVLEKFTWTLNDQGESRLMLTIAPDIQWQLNYRVREETLHNTSIYTQLGHCVEKRIDDDETE